MVTKLPGSEHEVIWRMGTDVCRSSVILRSHGQMFDEEKKWELFDIKAIFYAGEVSCLKLIKFRRIGHEKKIYNREIYVHFEMMGFKRHCGNLKSISASLTKCITVVASPQHSIFKTFRWKERDWVTKMVVFRIKKRMRTNDVSV